MEYRAKILVIRFSSIGDIVLCSPVLRCLHEQFLGGCEIHFLVKSAFAAIPKSNPYISKVHVLSGKTSNLLPSLKSEKFDYIIDLQKSARSWQIKKALGVLTFSFPKLNIQKWMYVNFKLNVLPKKHIVDRYFEAVKAFEIKNDFKGLDFFIPNNTEPLPFAPDTHFLAYAFGGKHKGKVLPEKDAIAILKKVKIQVILLGGNEDENRGDKIAIAAGNHVVNLSGKLSLMESAQFLKQSKAVLAHDTGLMHIAAAFKKDIVSLWGGTSPIFGMYPYLPGNKSAIIEVENNFLRPSSKLGNPTIFNPNPMNGIPISKVLTALGKCGIIIND